MALKDAVDDVRGTHSFRVFTEDQFDVVLGQVLLVDLESLQVRLAVVFVALDRVEDVVRLDLVQDVPLLSRVVEDLVHELAGEQHVCPLHEVHGGALPLELLDVVVGVEHHRDIP